MASAIKQKLEWRPSSAADHDCAPALPPLPQQPAADEAVELEFPWPQERPTDSRMLLLVRAAWAVVVGRETNSKDVVFGGAEPERSTTTSATGTTNGETAVQETEPAAVHVQWTSDQKVTDYLEAVQQLFEPTQCPGESPSSRQYQTCTLRTTCMLPVRTQQQRSAADDLGVPRTHAVVLEAQLGQEIKVTARFDQRLMQARTGLSLLQRLACVAGQLAAAAPEQAVKEMETATGRDIQQVWAWNGEVPPAVDRCVHELVEEQARARPDAVAVCAWDGELTYGELDRLAARVAGDLVGRGVGPDSLVPLCFEKSKWTTVAMLAVLKAGGGFVLLDASLPEQRLRNIVDQADARLLLSSPSRLALSSRLAPVVLLISSDSFAHPGNQPDRPLPLPSPSSVMYLVFTSGSTGNPKGVIVTHRNFSTAVLYQAPDLGLSAESRVFDFASYAFDASVSDTFLVLATGGCLCVPSDQDRAGNISLSIASLKANVVDVPPSVAPFLIPQELPDVQTLIFSGEALHTRHFHRWWDRARIINVYGPAECSPISLVNGEASSPEAAVRIGRGSGAVTWVVDPDNYDCLLPVGCVGELLLEGPLLGRGYLHEPAKTAAAFIHDPAWLLRGAPGRPGRHGRLYRTGDLVRYNEDDGSLSFVGRRDEQVKIRGQRVELGEVEHRVHECLPQARQVVAEVVAPEGSSAALAAFLEMPDERSAARLLPADADVEDRLGKLLPSYMMPSIFMALPEMPKTASGKIDRRRLREMGASLSAQQLADTRTTSGTKRAPVSKTEQQMQAIWAQVLNIDQATVGLDDSFLRLGGDSITAMQVASAARSRHIHVSVADILGKKTISKLVDGLEPSSVGEPVSRALVSHETLGGRSMQLSPIQNLYVQLQPDPTKCCFDQNFFLSVNGRITRDSLSAALETIVRRHTVFCARFTRNQEGMWEQRITPDASASFRLFVDESGADKTAHAIAQCRDSLNLEDGPLFAALLFDDPAATQRLFLTMPHSIVDLVSWRVLLRELEALLTSGTLTMPPPLGFQSWTALQAEYAAEKLDPAVTAPTEVRPPLLEYWGMDVKENLEGGAVFKRSTLDVATSSAILNGCNDALSTRPLELMIAALLHAFGLVFSDRPLPPIFSEGHGREPWDDSIDISATVGWFTTLWPVQISSGKNASLIDTIRRTKDCVRALPRKGWSWFTSRFADAEKAARFASGFPVEILFNYQGLYQQLERSDAIFEQIDLPHGSAPASSSAVQRFAFFEIDARVERGRIVTSVAYHKEMGHQQRIAEWVEKYEETLVQMSKELPEMLPSWTLMEFPAVFSSYEDIEEFQNVWLDRLGILRLEDVEDIFPCSPMQEAILVSQAKDSNNYRPWSLYEIKVRGEGARLDMARLQQAWQAVVRRHGLMRAIFVDGLPGSDGTMHVVLRDPSPSISVLEEAGEAMVSRLRNMDDTGASYPKLGLQHHVTICQLDAATAYMRLDINHTISDGFSQDLVLRDLQAAYHGSLGPAGTYRDFVACLAEQPKDAGIEFWSGRLAGVEPCLFPALGGDDIDRAAAEAVSVKVPNLDAGKIRAFCTRWTLTAATLTQTAWALVLSKYTGATMPCFGNLYSGRDVPVHKAETISGPLMGMAPCRVLIDRSKSVLDTLTKVQEDFLGSMAFQHVPLAAIHRALGLGTSALFNSTLSFQRPDDEGRVGADSVVVRNVYECDPTEYDVTISAFDRGCLSQAVSEIISDPTRSLGELDLLGPSDLEQIWGWNKTLPEPAEQCVHEMVKAKAQAHPDAPAICAWDGNLTYGELDLLASRLARRLVDSGVEPGMMLALCFDKSMWTTVAILGVMMAGGSFVLLDPSLPEQRLQFACQKARANLILSSTANQTLSLRLCQKVVAFDSDFFDQLDKTASSIDDLPSVDLDSIIYL
ncbi:hypothetical protein CDD83_4996 [Cordyceps sp. RAO-2017]|nr:hypothetical protein CDD83_4996 [Cordyceps sp. RAO-2017]